MKEELWKKLKLKVNVLYLGGKKKMHKKYQNEANIVTFIFPTNGSVRSVLYSRI